jgi:hypothetical protein
MSPRVSRSRIAQVAAAVLGVLVLGMGALTVVLDSVTHYPGNPGGPVADALTTAAAGVPVACVATVLAARRPGNPIGWLLFAIVFAGANPSSEYDVWAYRMHPGTAPLGWVSVVFQQLWPLFLVLIAVLLWVFPDGKLPVGRWRRPSVVLVVTGLLLGTAASSSSAVLVARHDVHITATGDVDGSAGAVFGILDVAVVVLSLAAWLVWLVIQIPGYREADGERRQQLKWLYSGAAITLVTFILGVFVIPVALGGAPGSAANPVVGALFVVAFGALPAFMGVAVLKYRLYELDRIISRVVSYTLVTGLLVGVYAGLVLLATHVLPFHSAVAVAVSTLICAALFNPVRRRVQHAVDRRFNRSQYNAQAVVEAFTVRLQHHVGLDLVQQDLISAVNQAFQPTQVTIFPWSGTPPEPGAAATGQSGANSHTQAVRDPDAGQDSAEGKASTSRSAGRRPPTSTGQT